jgi:hypothetical protein
MTGRSLGLRINFKLQVLKEIKVGKYHRSMK